MGAPTPVWFQYFAFCVLFCCFLGIGLCMILPLKDDFEKETKTKN